MKRRDAKGRFAPGPVPPLPGRELRRPARRVLDELVLGATLFFGSVDGRIGWYLSWPGESPQRVHARIGQALEMRGLIRIRGTGGPGRLTAELVPRTGK